MRNCPKCGMEYEAGQRFCAECGVGLAPAEVETFRCQVCGKVYTDGSKFCTEDGEKIVASNLAEDQQFSPNETTLTTSFVSEDYRVDIGGLIRSGWELMIKDIGLHIGLLLLVWVVTAIVSAIPVLNLVVGVAVSPLAAGSLIIAFKRAQGQIPKFEDGLLGLERYVPLMLLALVSGLMASLGLVLLVIPGVYLIVSYVLAFPLAVDRNMQYWDAMETSRKVVSKRFFPILGLVLVLGLIVFLGCIPMGLGLLFTVPLTSATTVVLYEKIFGFAGKLPVKGKVLSSIGLAR